MIYLHASRLYHVLRLADNRKRADAEVVTWKFKYEKAEQAKRYAQTHQKTAEVAVEKKVLYEKCDNCDRIVYCYPLSGFP